MNLSLDSCGSKTILFCFLKKNPPMMQSSLCFSAEAKGWQLLSASLMFGEHKRRCKLWNLLLQGVVDAKGLQGLVEICCRLLNSWKPLSFWKSQAAWRMGEQPPGMLGC